MSKLLNLIGANATINDIETKMLPNKKDAATNSNMNLTSINPNSNAKSYRKNSVLLVCFKKYKDELDFMNKKKLGEVLLQKKLV